MTCHRPVWAWRPAPIALAGGDLDETVCSHLGDYIGAKQLFDFFDRWDICKIQLVCKELYDNSIKYTEFKRRHNPEWTWPLGKLQGRVTTCQGFIPRIENTYEYYGALHAVKHHDTILAGGMYAGGYQDGPCMEAKFNTPRGMALGDQGELFIADTGNHVIRKLQNGLVTTLAGKAGRAKYCDGQGSNARFTNPCSLVYRQGLLYVLDGNAERIRTIDSKGNVKTLCGNSNWILKTTEQYPYIAYIKTPVNGVGKKARFTGRDFSLRLCKDGSLLLSGVDDTHICIT